MRGGESGSEEYAEKGGVVWVTFGEISIPMRWIR